MATIIARDHPSWVEAEQFAKDCYGKSLAQLGFEGQVLEVLQHGGDPLQAIAELADSLGVEERRT